MPSSRCWKQSDTAAMWCAQACPLGGCPVRCYPARSGWRGSWPSPSCPRLLHSNAGMRGAGIANKTDAEGDLEGRRGCPSRLPAPVRQGLPGLTAKTLQSARRSVPVAPILRVASRHRTRSILQILHSIPLCGTLDVRHRVNTLAPRSLAGGRGYVWALRTRGSLVAVFVLLWGRWRGRYGLGVLGHR